jgi:glucose/arabinose dehydrogenase
MMDVAVHPRFAENNLIYLTYAKPKDNLTTTALMRARLAGMRLEEAKDICGWSSTARGCSTRATVFQDGRAT